MLSLTDFCLGNQLLETLCGCDVKPLDESSLVFACVVYEVEKLQVVAVKEEVTKRREFLGVFVSNIYLGLARASCRDCLTF